VSVSGASSSPPEPALAPLFELDEVRLVLDGHRILDGLTLGVPDGGITVLLGPSGAGKSMTLRLLNRLEVPTSGEVRFRGEDIASLDPLRLRRRVGMVFQRPAVFPGTVRDNLRVASPEADDTALAGFLDAGGLDPGMIDRVGDELSGGEAQRLCLARTLATRPEVLLMDEPTSALDPTARHHLEATARRLADGGMPMVWVTHDLGQAERLADHRLVLVAGRLAGDEEVRRYLAQGGAAGDDDAAEGAAGDGDDRRGTPAERTDGAGE
jgi:putative ABC transport system ATP-binding protein